MTGSERDLPCAGELVTSALVTVFFGLDVEAHSRRKGIHWGRSRLSFVDATALCLRCRSMQGRLWSAARCHLLTRDNAPFIRQQCLLIDGGALEEIRTSVFPKLARVVVDKGFEVVGCEQILLDEFPCFGQDLSCVRHVPMPHV
jgi:hypothetical protein